MNLRWTNAGRAALAGAEHVGPAAVRLTHCAIGDGSGPGGAADDGRAALRNERDRSALAGVASEGRIAARADFAPAASWGITEVGIFGTSGDPPGAAELYLYWTDNGNEGGRAAAGTDLAIAMVVEFQDAAAEVAVTVGGNIVFGATDPATEAAFGSTRYATAAETGEGTAANRAVTPSGLHAAAGKVLASLLGGEPGDGTIYQLKGTASGGLIVERRTATPGVAANAVAIAGLAGRVRAVEGRTGSATTAVKGIVELATSAEAKTGTDAARAVTPKAMHDAASKIVESLLAGAVEADKQYVLEGVDGGGLRLVRSGFLSQLGGVTVRTREFRDGGSGPYDSVAAEFGAGEAWQLEAGDWLLATWYAAAPPIAPNFGYGVGGWSARAVFSPAVRLIQTGVRSDYRGNPNVPQYRGVYSGIVRVPNGGTTMTPRVNPVVTGYRALTQAEEDTAREWVSSDVMLGAVAVALSGGITWIT